MPGYNVTIVNELVPTALLTDVLEAYEFRRMDESEMAWWIAAAVRSLGTLHRSGIVHGHFNSDDLLCEPIFY